MSDQNTSDRFEIVSPSTLLTKERFDVVAKYIYAKDYISKEKNDWAEYVYREHLRAINSFREKNNNKREYSDFKETFEALISSMNSDGFVPERGLIPLGNNSIPVNGAHRVGASIALGLDVCVKRVEKKAHSYDYKYFLKRNLSTECLDYMALQYGRIKKEFHTAIIFPVASANIAQIKKIVDVYGTIFYEKDVSLCRNGIHNLVLQMYGDQSWTNSAENRGYSKTLAHSYNRFLSGEKTIVLLIENTSLGKMREAKAKVRELFDLGNYPIHICDDGEDSLRLAKQMLNKNSVDFLNITVPKNNHRFNQLFTIYRAAAADKGIDRDSVCIVGSGVLSAYGLRDSADLDYISLRSDPILEKGVNLHRAESKEAAKYQNTVINDPRKHFYFNGYKFLSIIELKITKKKRGEIKDRADVDMIESLLNNEGFPRAVVILFHKNFFVVLGSVIHNARRHTPRFLYPTAQTAYRLVKQIFS